MHSRAIIVFFIATMRLWHYHEKSRAVASKIDSCSPFSHICFLLALCPRMHDPQAQLCLQTVSPTVALQCVDWKPFLLRMVSGWQELGLREGPP